jgi:alkanesulfonate monooxygenase SsuD/methylene tetrahydromethanopterin reductase-like flavin-dependent oxidoreductase (luciferase family)
MRAAKHGLPVVFAIIGGDPAQFKPLFEYYRKAYEQYGHNKEKFRVGVHMHAFFGENSEEVADYYYPVYSSQMDRVGRSRGWPPYQESQYDFGRSSKGHLLVGDANEAIDKILHMKEMFGLTRFSAHMDVGGPAHDKMMKSIEIFGTKIAPEVRKHQ